MSSLTRWLNVDVCLPTLWRKFPYGIRSTGCFQVPQKPLVTHATFGLSKLGAPNTFGRFYRTCSEHCTPAWSTLTFDLGDWLKSEFPVTRLPQLPLLSIQGQLIGILLATVGILQKSVKCDTFWFKLIRQLVSNEGICASNVYFNCKLWVSLEVRPPFQGNSWQGYKWMHWIILEKLHTNWFYCYFIVTTLKWSSV